MLFVLSMISSAKSNLEKAVPRYTSYPTAPHFSSAINADIYRSWLQSLSDDVTLSLYLHVPYCRTLCYYCGCHTKATRQRDPIDVYADRLVDEIATVANSIGRHKVTHLHWGGGTPSILGNEVLKSVSKQLSRHFDFATNVEHAIELDPRHLTEPLAQTSTRDRRQPSKLGCARLWPPCATSDRPNSTIRSGRGRGCYASRRRKSIGLIST